MTFRYFRIIDWKDYLHIYRCLVEYHTNFFTLMLVETKKSSNFALAIRGVAQSG